MRFSVALDNKNWMKDFEQEVNRSINEVNISALLALKDFSPVKTGNLRDSWKITVNGIPVDTSVFVGGFYTPQNVGFINDCGYAQYANDGTERMAGRFFIEQALSSVS